MKKLLKICGMVHPDNISEILMLQPDYLGFIFYEKSPRYVKQIDNQEFINNLKVKKVGVFVDESPSEIVKISQQYGLDVVQVHGCGSQSDLDYLKSHGLQTWKVCSVANEEDLIKIQDLKPDVFLFDSKGKSGFGGHGYSFDWNLLKNFQSDIPFFVAGGLDVENIQELLALELPNMIGIDVNSRFETSPGIKNYEKLRQLIQ